MNIAIVYSSNTGNTETIAKAIKEELKNENIVYFGKVVEEIPEADLYFIGSWTDKGNASKDIIEFVKKITNKKIAYFGTAGYGGSENYYNSLFERIKVNIDKSNEVLGYFYCQGKMPIQVKERYVKMMTEHPDDANLKVSIHNFDEALKHPNGVDLDNVRKWAKNIKNTTQNQKNVIK